MYDGWDEGRAAALAGRKLSDCPHPPTSYSYVTWHTGWANTTYWIACGYQVIDGTRLSIDPVEEFKPRAIKRVPLEEPQQRRRTGELF